MKKLILSLTFVLLICALVSTLSGCTLISKLVGLGESHTHQYVEEITKAPTCSEEGEKTFTCSCNDSYTEAIEKLPHTEEAIPSVDPTCTETGLTEGKRCSVCEEIILAQEPVAALGHAGTKVAQENFVDSTCSAAGSYESVEYCTVCNAEVSRTTVSVEKKAHTEVVDAAVAPTCTEEGKTEGKYCSVCSEVIVAQESVAALGHTEQTLPAKDATCTATGLTEGKACSTCGEILVAQETVDYLSHIQGEWEVTTSATCTTAGERVAQCTVCGSIVAKETIAALDHDMVTDAAVAPTCTATGLTEGSHCSRCDYKIAQDVVDALGHKGGTATCMDAKVCEVCGVSYGTPDKVNGHDYGEADCDSPATCKLCGQTSGEAIGHADENKDHKCDRCQTEQGAHEDKDKDHVCDYGCNQAIGSCEDKDLDHKCDHGCAKTFGEHADLDKNHSCDYGCKDAIGEHKDGDADQDHNCDYCGKFVDGEECVDANKNHKCDECFGTMGDHKDSDGDGDHLCDYCNGSVEGEVCKGGQATCTNKAVCTECGKEYGEKLDHTYDKAVASEQTMKLGATCTASAVYYYSCSCGDINKAEDAATFEYGESLGHKDENLDHACDNGCSVYQGEHSDSDTDGDHLCDYGCGSNASEHSYVEKVTAPTCEAQGYTTHSCNCGDSYVDSYVASLGHAFDDDFDATCNRCDYERVIIDTTANKLVNGGFENGLEGWTVVGNIGSVSSDTHYWLNDPERAEGYAFGMDGNGMFSAYVHGAEERAVGTLTSSTFVIGGSGFVTFKVGAMRDNNYVYIDVVDADTKQILARYYNGLWADRTDGVKSGCTLIAYKADLSEFMGREVFFRISDNADSGYGLFFVDSFITYYENEPEGFNNATAVDYALPGTIYDVFNGDFEMGNVQGWWNIGEIGLVTDAFGYWGDNIEYGKHGSFLFTGVESFGADTMREGNKGTLTSSVFEISGTGYISFMLGGGGNELCYVQIIDAVSGEVLARYRQQAQQDAKLIQYVADLSAHLGKTARIQVVDLATSGWGCVSFDNVVTYYASVDALPAGITANNVFHGNYNVNNGSFESGLDGWHQNIWDAGSHNTLGWVESSEHDAGWYTKNDGRKDGNNLFTFCKPNGTNCENTKGELVSSTFTLKQNSYVSFRFGGAGSREVRVELVRVDGSVIATFYNEAPGKINTEMHAYFYQYTGETTDCFFRVVDDSVSNYGCFVVDDFRANLASAPEGFIEAIR